MKETMTTEEMLAWIEQASYEDLLRKWRFEPTGSPWFVDDEISTPFIKRMEKLKAEGANHTQASKNIGW